MKDCLLQAVLGLMLMAGGAGAGEAPKPPAPPGEKDLRIDHPVGAPDKDGSFTQVGVTVPYAHVITVPVESIKLIPPGTIKEGSFWPKTVWSVVEDTAKKNWVRTANPVGHRVHLLVMGKFGTVGRNDGGKRDSDKNDKKKDPEAPLAWSTLSVDLDLDADTNRDGQANLRDMDADLAEDPTEEAEKNIGAIVIVRPTGPAPLLLRQVLPEKPKPRPDGTVYITQEGTGHVRITEADKTEVTEKTDLWTKVKSAELPLQIEAGLDGKKEPQIGPCVITATYEAGSDLIFRDKVKVMVIDILPQVYGHPKDAVPAPRDFSPAYKWGENRFLFAREGDGVAQIRFRGDLRPAGPESLRQIVDAWCRWGIDDIPTIPRNIQDDKGKWNLYLPRPHWEQDADETKWMHAQGLRVGQTDRHCVEFFIKRLPQDNTGFGQRRLYLDLIGTPGGNAPKLCETRETKVRLFFARFKTDHPAAKKDDVTANWHFYWSKEGGAHPEGMPEKGKPSPVCMFSRIDTKWKQQGAGGAWGSTSKEGGEWKITLYDAAAQRETWHYKFPEKEGVPDTRKPEEQIRERPVFTIDTENAPDFVNLVYAHELTHKKIGARGKAPKGGNNPYAEGQENNDLDRDGILNGEEIAAGMNPRVPDSCKEAFTISRTSPASRDEEFYCVLGGAFSPFGKLTKPAELEKSQYSGGVAEDANEHNDWSKGGVQWQKD